MAEANLNIIIDENSRDKFRNRPLSDKDDVFSHNAWDNVEWTQEQEVAAAEAVSTNSSERLSPSQIDEFDRQADHHWDVFYSIHNNRFFKDRSWLFVEFPELNWPSSQIHSAVIDSSDPKSENPKDDEVAIFEVGCGVGNTIFPLLRVNRNPNLLVYGCDFSQNAIEIVQQHEEFEPKRCQVFVHDIASDQQLPIAANTVDIILLIFVFSAISPSQYDATVTKLVQCLKPGGRILFRDYGRFDMAQLGFKKGRCLGDNFYVRGDGTRSYFFTQDEVMSLFVGAGLKELQNISDKRLQVNRGKKLQMYRIWIQAKYQKPSATDR